ncbi:hypothetical protein ILUMI_17866, partial [Ignelater luminosus]
MCCNVLKIFKDVTEEISVEKEVTISKAIIFSAVLVKYCKRFSKDNPILADIIKKLIESLQASLHIQKIREINFSGTGTVRDNGINKLSMENSAIKKKKPRGTTTLLLIVKRIVSVSSGGIIASSGYLQTNMEWCPYEKRLGTP